MESELRYSDYQACLKYLVIYICKEEKSSSVFNNALTNVAQEIKSDTSDIHGIFKQSMIKTVGQRDHSVQEVMHHLLSLKGISSAFEVIIIQMGKSKEFCTVLLFLIYMLDETNMRSHFLKYYSTTLCNLLLPLLIKLQN